MHEVLTARAQLAEGPRWDAASGMLLWVDIPRGEVHRFDPGTGAGVVHRLAAPVGAVAPRARGGIVAALPDGLHAVGPDGGHECLVDAPLPDDHICNDGACDERGRLWIGAMAADERPGSGVLRRIDPDGTVTVHLDGLTIPNGVGWAPDGAHMYYIDSPTCRIDVHPFDAVAGTLGPARLFAAVAPEDGMPDGLCVDRDGGVWVALWGGGRVRRHLPDGTLDREIAVPATLVTACALGGADGRTLFVTTADARLNGEPAGPGDRGGSLFAVRVPVPGAPATAWGG